MPNHRYIGGRRFQSDRQGGGEYTSEDGRFKLIHTLVGTPEQCWELFQVCPGAPECNCDYPVPDSCPGNECATLLDSAWCLYELANAHGGKTAKSDLLRPGDAHDVPRFAE